MIKTLRNIGKQDKEKFVVPKGVQDVIPVTAIYDDGIFRIGNIIKTLIGETPVRVLFCVNKF